jgi:hypothetical protein
MREIMRDDDCNSKTKTKTKKTEFEECQIAPGMTPKKGYLT